MEHTLIFGALATGLLGWLCALLLSLGARPAASKWRRDLVIFAVASPFAVWLLTLPTTAPFSSGQGFGRGFLLGGLASLLSAFVVWRADNLGESNALERIGARAAACAPLFAALALVCVPLLWMRASVIDALMGAALGWLSVAFVLTLSVKSASSASLTLFNGAAFGVALCGAAALGVYRDFVVADVARGTFPAVVVTLAASVILALLIAAFAAEIAPNSFLSQSVATLFCLVMPLGVAALLAMRILSEMNVVWVVATGALLGVTLWWLALDQNAGRGFSAAIVVALCGFMFSYQLLQGLGVGLMLLGAWPFSILALTSRAPQIERLPTARAVTLSLSFATVLLLSRLFEARFGADLRGAGFEDQYALFGFIAGAALPLLSCAVLWPNSSQSENVRSDGNLEREVGEGSISLPNRLDAGASLPRDAGAPLLRDVGASLPRDADVSLPRVLGAVALALALLAVALMLWGAKIAPAFFAGLALSAAGIIIGARRSLPDVSALFALALALSLSQWTHHFAPLSELSRMQRLHLVVWVLGVTLVLLLVADYGARLVSALRAPRVPREVTP